MNIERLRKIIEYSENNREGINSKVKQFCAYTGIDSSNDVLNVLQITRSSFRKKGYLVLEMPFADDEIGALCYKGDGLGYVVINTSLPAVNTNFALAHEIYHVFFQKNDYISKVEFVDDHYYTHKDENDANLFAGMLLMPEASFRRMYLKFKEESEGEETATIIRLMAYYQVPYMAVLIRCYELKLIDSKAVSVDLLGLSRTQIRDKFEELWLDTVILDASNKDDYPHIEGVVRKFGRECIDEGYINDRTLAKVLQNMQKLNKKIKGE